MVVSGTIVSFYDRPAAVKWRGICTLKPMALFSREFIAVPDDRKDQIVFKWPDVNIRKFTKAIVDADEMALFVSKGAVVGTMGPGQHKIDADELPFLGVLIDAATGGNAYRAELYFVGTREYTGEPFGGRIDNVTDPQTGFIVTLRVYGDYSVKVNDPVKLVTQLTGTVDITDNAKITDWVDQQLLKVMRTDVTQNIVRNGWPVLGLAAYIPDIEKSVIELANAQLEPYGLALARMGNFDINLGEEDEASLKKLAKDTQYSKLAGGFQQYADASLKMGAGEGMAKGGAATGGAFLATGVNVGQQATQPAAPAPPPAAAPAPAAAAATPTPAGAHFCANCGTALPEAAKFCPSCGTAIASA
jgi:membrane protease subunit (stomatin/prohibitin family)